MSGWVRNQRWRPGTGSRYELTYISACMRDGNEIPTATPMCFRSCNMTALVQILSYVRVSGISKMAAYNRKPAGLFEDLTLFISSFLLHYLELCRRYFCTINDYLILSYLILSYLTSQLQVQKSKQVNDILKYLRFFTRPIHVTNISDWWLSQRAVLSP